MRGTALLVAVATPRLPRRSQANYRNSFQQERMMTSLFFSRRRRKSV